MKIYTYVRMDLFGNIIDSISYEYVGNICKCKGADTVNFPAPTIQEQQLLNDILTQLSSSRELQEKFIPLLVGAAGYTYDTAGNLIQMPIADYLSQMNPIFRQQYENLQLIQEQTNKMLEGDYSANPALEQQLGEEKQNLENTLSARLGPDWQQTTAGIQAMSEFNRNALSLREASRQEQLSNYSSMASTGLQNYLTGQQAPLSYATGLQNYTTGLLNNYNQALQPYQWERQQQYAAALKNMEAQQSQSAGIGQFIGTIGGGALGGYLGGAEGAALGASIGSTAMGGGSIKSF